MGLSLFVGIITILCSPEPKALRSKNQDKDHSFSTAVIGPFKDFMKKPYWIVILLFVVFYKLCDAYLGAMANPFYIEMGFSNIEIAEVSKIYGMITTIIGGIIGGVFVVRYGLMQSLIIGAILQAASNLVFVPSGFGRPSCFDV